MVLRCERAAGRWTCQAGWDLRVRASGDSAEAAFRRLCFELALDPADFLPERAGDAVRLVARGPDAAAAPDDFWEGFDDPARLRPAAGFHALRRVLAPVLARLGAA